MSKLEFMVLTIVLCLCTFMQVLDYSIANVSIPYIAGGLGVSDNDGTWVITMFAVGNAICLPLSGWLARRFGAVRTMVLSVVMFTFFSWLCGAAWSFNSLVLFRFIQGFVGGPMIPLSQSLLIQIFPETKKNLALAIWVMVAVVGPIAGPILGGWITFDYVWRWIFYINVPVGVICSIFIWHFMKNKESTIVKEKVDYMGLVFLAVGISSLQIMLDKGEQYDWFRNPVIILLAITSIVFLTFLIVWEKNEPHPILDLTLFRSRNFTLGTVLTSGSYMIIFGAIVLTPLWLQDYMGYTSLWAGLAVSTMGVIPVCIVMFVAWLMNRIRLKFILIFSFLCFAATFFYFAYFTTQVSFRYVAFSRLLFGIPIAFWLPPLMALTLAGIPATKLANATGIFHFFRIFAGGAGTSLFVTLWDRRSIFHHSNLASQVTAFNENSKEFLGKLDQLNLPGKEGLTMLNNITDKQASILGMNDVFYLSAWLFIILLIGVFCLKRREHAQRDASTLESK